MKKLLLSFVLFVFAFIGGTHAQCLVDLSVSPNSGCPNSEALFYLRIQADTIVPGSGYTADWQNGLGETLVFSKTFTPVTDTTVNVTVRYRSGNQVICIQHLSLTYQVTPSELIDLHGPMFGLCQGETGYYYVTNNQNIIIVPGNGWGFWWSTGQENVNGIYTSDNSVWVKVMFPDGCEQTLALNAPILIAPKVTINSSGDLCGGGVTLFADVESASGCPFATWSNGSIGLATSITSPGFYTVTITDDNGCSTTASINVTQNAQLPTVNFIHSASGQTVVFQNLSSGGSFRIWNFGDGTSSEEINPTHTYSTSGTFTVLLTESNCCGMKQFSKTVTIQPIVITPTASFTASTFSGCAPLTSTFSSNSSNATSLSWIFEGGNPSSSNSSNPTVVFSTVGPHTVTLTATNVNGSHSVSQTVTVVGFLPTAGFLAIENLMSIKFINQSIGEQNYYWTFGDGHYSYEPEPNHVYSSAGDYYASLTVYNDCGSHTIIKKVTARCMRLESGATPDPIPLGYCTYLSTDAIGTNGNVQYTWSPSSSLPNGPFGFQVLACPTESMWFYVEALNLETQCIAYDSVFVTVWGGEPGGLTDDEVLGKGRISIIPNPATDFISGTLPEGDYLILLYDLSGKEVKQLRTDGYFEMDIQNLPAAHYLLHITEGDNVIKTEIITIIQ